MDVLGAFLGGLLQQLGLIFYTIVLPILLLAGIGFALQRRFGLEMTTLRRLNFYFVMPAMVYYAVVTSSLAAGDVGKVVGFTVACLCVQAALITIQVRAALDDRAPAVFDDDTLLMVAEIGGRVVGTISTTTPRQKEWLFSEKCTAVYPGGRGRAPQL